MDRTTRETRRQSYDAVLPKREKRCRLILETLGAREMTASEITIEKAAKDAETATATKMAECIAGGIKDTVEAIHRDPDGFFKGGAR